MEEKAKKIKILFLDVDGVLTDGKIIINNKGEETKAFNVKDGLGLKRLMKHGIQVVWITGRKSRIVEYRANELGIREVYQAVKDKGMLLKKIMAKKGFIKENVCSMGDDIPDLAMFEVTGLSIAVADAVREIRMAADFITRTRGGQGAVREACEWLLQCQDG